MNFFLLLLLPLLSIIKLCKLADLQNNKLTTIEIKIINKYLVYLFVYIGIRICSYWILTCAWTFEHQTIKTKHYKKQLYKRIRENKKNSAKQKN